MAEQANRRGWARGRVIGERSDWLTITGSAIEAPTLHETAEDAAATPVRLGGTVAYVEEQWQPGVTGVRQWAYKILRLPPHQYLPPMAIADHGWCAVPGCGEGPTTFTHASPEDRAAFLEAQK
jgi:D-serine deaminase-like pyridoxal phosphate-dependent protein